MKVPERVKIGIHCYDVEVLENIRGDFSPTISNDLGGISYDGLKIRISAQYPHEIQIEAFLHEVAHGILSEMEEEKLRRDEKFVSLLGKQLYVFLTENDFFK